MNQKIISKINLKKFVENYFGFRHLSVTAKSVMVLALTAATVLGCGWDFTSDHSVRFNGLRSEKDFGRLPPLPLYESDGKTAPSTYGGEAARDYERTEQYRKKIKETWDRAVSAREQGDLWTLRKSLREFIERTDHARSHGWQWRNYWQKERDWAIDMLDALEALDHGSPTETVQSYIAARWDYDSGKPAEEVKRNLDGARKDRNLADNVLYLEAALLYRDSSGTPAKEFNRLVAKYPKSEKREAALFMAGVAAMKQSQSFVNAQEFGAKSAPCVECRDASWREARESFERLLREYPQGRYAIDARGWLAYLSLGVGDRAGALVEYYRMLANGKNPVSRSEAIVSLRLTRHRADDAEMRQVEKQLAGEPRVALVYAYHNIYNYALPPLLRWNEPDEDRLNKMRTELERVVAFSTAMMRRYPNLEVGGAFALRVAQANLELDLNQAAAEMARRAQKSSVKGEERAEALFIEGVAEHRLKRYKEARRALTNLVTDHTNSRLIENGRRSLAMVAEDMGDLDAALEQYLALDYKRDVAYFIDVLLTTEQLAAFIKKHDSIPHRDELMYGLGIRYLRDRRWNDARSTLSQIQTVGRGADDEYNSHYSYYDRYSDDERLTAKEESYDPSIRGVRLQWVEQDLRTADALERLEKAVDLAEGDEAKAEALYQLASYQFQGTLLFYNPLAWDGVRHSLLEQLDSDGSYRQPGEAQLLFQNMQQHDRAARSLPVFLEVVRRFPSTRAARDALYTAAVCHDRLSEYNYYWRQIYGSGGYAGERMVTYKDVKRAYPDYSYPQGTYGWEPATRTVNGGPGWLRPPKPKPRPSRTRRALTILDGWMKEMNRSILALDKGALQMYQAIDAALARLGYRLWLIVALSGLVALNWRAWIARKSLRTELARCRPCPVDKLERAKSKLEVSWLSSRFDAYLNQETCDEWKMVFADFVYRSRQLARDEAGRPVLVVATALHAAIIVLILMVLIL